MLVGIGFALPIRGVGYENTIIVTRTNKIIVNTDKNTLRLKMVYVVIVHGVKTRNIYKST